MYRSKEYVDAPEVEKVALDIIKKENLEQIVNVEVKYVLVYPNLSKTTVGRCKVASHDLHHFSGADYLIEISGEVWDSLPATMRRNLVWHLLEHIDPQYNEKRGEWNFKTRDHTVKDFKRIIDDQGIGWQGDLKTMVASIYDMDPEQQDRIKL